MNRSVSNLFIKLLHCNPHCNHQKSGKSINKEANEKSNKILGQALLLSKGHSSTLPQPFLTLPQPFLNPSSTLPQPLLIP